VAKVTSGVGVAESADEGNRFIRWLFIPAPLGRVAVLRTLIYLFIPFDVLVYSTAARYKADVPTDLYVPLNIARLFPVIPEPTSLVVHITIWGLLILSPLAATGRAPRLLGTLVFALYFEWMLIDMSYGKVDHDRFAFMVALAVLPSVGVARHGDQRRSAKAGWALRVVQLAVIATYFLAACAKLRFGGIEWLWGTTLTWAILRRGTELSHWMLNYPWLIKVSQVGIVLFELMSPIVFFVNDRLRAWVVTYFYVFHLVTWLAITISFAPHLVAMGSFLKLEKVRPVHWIRQADGSMSRRGRPAAEPA
jgi:Vitamin K-dependent gamma-carboxylase